MKIIFYTFFLCLSSTTVFVIPYSTKAAETPFHICYFSLNNEKEIHVMQKLVKQLNKKSPRKIVVTEFQKEGTNPEESFMKMMDSMLAKGQRCNGLVISGHHTGSFGGKRGTQNLGIDFLEKQACNPKYKDWFSGINSLWLQGCRTLGIGDLETIAPNDTRADADFHMLRVGQVLEEDNLSQGFAALNMEFSATLDRDNPLSSRYLRVFPRATVFGWTQTAPGEKAGSENSILYHMAHMGRLMDDRKEFFDNPVKSKIDDRSTAQYALALLATLQDFGENRVVCEELAVDAWLKHGKGGKYAFLNPDLNAYLSLESKNDKDLREARELGCILKEAKDRKEIVQAIKAVLKNEVQVAYNFNAVWGVVQGLEKSGKLEDLIEVKKLLRNSPELQKFLMEKLSSPSLGLVRKIDYYTFYKDMTGESVAAIEKLILEGAKKQLSLEAKPGTRHAYDLSNYQNTLLQSLVKNKFTNKEFWKNFSDFAAPTVLRNIPSIAYNLDKETLKEMQKALLKSPKAYSHGVAAYLIIYAENSASDTAEMLKEILKSERTDTYTLIAVASTIRDAKEPISGASEMLKEILNSPKADYYTLTTVASAIRDAKEPINGGSEMLKEILKSPKASANTLGAVASAIGNAKEPINGGSEMLKEILKSPKAGANTLGAVANAIGNAKEPINGGSEILKEILNSPKADSYTLSSVASAIRYAKEPISGASEMLKEILNSPKANSYTLSSVAGAIAYSKEPISNSSEILKEILNSPKADASTLRLVANILKK